MRSEAKREYDREYNKTHRAARVRAQNRWREAHKDDPEYKRKMLEARQKWYQKHKNDPEFKAKVAAARKRYKQKHKKDLMPKQVEYNKRYRARRAQHKKYQIKVYKHQKTPDYLLFLNRAKNKDKYKSPAAWLIHDGKLTAKEARKLSEAEIIDMWLEEI